jgi:hypothetical protein
MEKQSQNMFAHRFWEVQSSHLFVRFFSNSAHYSLILVLSGVMSVMEIVLLLLPPVAFLVVPVAVGDVEVEVVVVLIVGMILEVVVGLGVVSLCTHCGCSNHSVDYC